MIEFKELLLLLGLYFITAGVIGIIFYALIHSMNIDDFVYYNCLIEETKKTFNTTGVKE